MASNLSGRHSKGFLQAASRSNYGQFSRGWKQCFGFNRGPHIGAFFLAGPVPNLGGRQTTALAQAAATSNLAASSRPLFQWNFGFAGAKRARLGDGGVCRTMSQVVFLLPR